jgi:hypothetical protein
VEPSEVEPSEVEPSEVEPSEVEPSEVESLVGSSLAEASEESSPPEAVGDGVGSLCCSSVDEDDALGLRLCAAAGSAKATATSVPTRAASSRAWAAPPVALIALTASPLCCAVAAATRKRVHNGPPGSGFPFDVQQRPPSG